MGSTTVQLFELGREAITDIYAQIQSVAPEVWVMAQAKVVAGAWLRIIMPPIIIILSSITIIVGYKLNNDDLEHPVCITGFIVLAVSFVMGMIAIPCGIYELMAQDYFTLKTVIGLVKP